MILKSNKRKSAIRAESQIVAAARRGDVDSFAELYERYYAVMVWLAYSILLDRDLAEDAAQQSFAVASEQLAHLRQADKFAAWLAGICRNVARQMLRRRKRELVIDGPPAVSGQDDNDELSKTVKEAIANLPGMYRRVVVLHYYNDMSYERIGQVLRISIDKVKGRLFRARKKIAKYLKHKGFE